MRVIPAEAGIQDLRRFLRHAKKKANRERLAFW
jgi:hypothetical protein